MRSFLVLAFYFAAGLSALTSGQTQDVKALQITGQVRMGGQPAPAGVPVILQIVSSRYATPSSEPEAARTTTDSKGRFVFDHLNTLGHNGGREFFAVSTHPPGYGLAYQVVDLTVELHGEATLILQKAEVSPQDPGSGPVASNSAGSRRPSTPEAQQALSRARELIFHQHDPEGGINEIKKALKNDPWYGPGYVLLGLAYMQTQRWDDAQFAFTEASKVEPGNAQAYLGLGSALNEQHDYAGARKALEHSLQLAPDLAEAHYELARTLGALGKWQEAEPHASRAIELNPDYAGPHALMGNVYLERQNLASALAEFREYLRLEPQGSLAPEVKQIIPEIEKAMDQDGTRP